MQTIMMKKKASVFLAAFLCFCGTFPFQCNAMEIEAISMPSVDVMLSFVMTGRVSEMRIKEGDPVKNGALLSSLDNRTEKLKVEELEANAKDRSRIEMAAADLAQKRIDLKKLEAAHAKGAVTRWELEHSRLNVRIAELSMQAVKLEHAQNRRRLDQAVSELDRMRLLSPVSGRVEKVLVKPGESAKALEPLIQVVGVDPLWVDMPVPLDQVKKLSVGQSVSIVFPGSPSEKKAEGRVIHISSVVDAASETLRVRVQAPNPEERPAGERVLIRFADGSQQAGPGDDSVTIRPPEKDKQ